MEPILPNTIPSAASSARGPAEQGEKAGSPDPAHAGPHRFKDILKGTPAGPENPAKGRSSAKSGRRTAIAGNEAKADASSSISAAVGGTAAPTAPNDSIPATGVEASEPKDAGPVNTGPVPVLAGDATLPADGDPLLKQLASGIHPAAADDEGNAAPAQAPMACAPGAVPAPPTAPASEPKGAGSAKTDPTPLLAGAATLAAEGDPLLKQTSSGMHPETADGEGNAAPAHAPRAGVPAPVSAPVSAPVPAPVPAPPAAAASEPKNAGSAKADGTPFGFGNIDPAQEVARDGEGARKKKVDAIARNEGLAEPSATPPADGNRGVVERPVALRPVAPPPDPAVVRFDEKAFVITRKSDTSVEVTLAPPGVGKLEIEVVLEKGIVNARIIAADPAGREAIAQSLPHIVEALARDGMNIGGFTVSLKGRRDRMEDSPGHGSPRDPGVRLPSAVAPAASTSAASAGLVDIFV